MINLKQLYYKRMKRGGEINPEDIFFESENVNRLNEDKLEGLIDRPLGKVPFYLLVIILALFSFIFLAKAYQLQIRDGEKFYELAENNRLKSTPIFSSRGAIVDRNGKYLAWNESTTTEKDKRVYVEGFGLSNLLGYVSYPKKDKKGVYWQGDYQGKDGIEKYYNDRLSGVPGQIISEADATHKLTDSRIVNNPIDGENVNLTIDSELNKILYTEIINLSHKAGFVSGAGMIIDVHTGEVYAMASYPEYDNNLITNASTTEEKKRLAEDLNNKNHKFLNRSISGLYTPGSTVKPFIALAALEEHIIDPNKNIFSSGALVLKNKYGGPDTVFRDWKAHGYVDMREAIAVSSDEYFYQVGGGYEDQKGLGIRKIKEYSEKYGLATSTNIDLPGENTGVIPDPEWKAKNFGDDSPWLVGNTYHTSIGQYGYQITPAELVRSVAMIANGGYLVDLKVNRDKPEHKVKVDLNPENLKVIQEGMRKAAEVGGTATRFADLPFEVAAKTGTAELGVDKALVNSWATGYFPYRNPKYAFVIMMEKASRDNKFGAVAGMKEVFLRLIEKDSEYIK